MMDNLFTTGRIFLIRQPIHGGYGPNRIYDLLMAGTFGVDIVGNKEETYVIFTTKRRQMLLIFHIDECGFDLTKRFIYAKSTFKILLEDTCSPMTLTREELRRLVLYGTYEADYETLKQENIRLRSELESLRSSGVVQ